LAQAIILIMESRMDTKYNSHRWLGIAHMAEAEAEIFSKYEDIAHMIRAERLNYIEDINYDPQLMKLIDEITKRDDASLAGSSPKS